MTKIKDSKQLSEKQREEIFEKIKNNSDLAWRVSFVWPKTIDRININGNYEFNNCRWITKSLNTALSNKDHPRR